jgi:murein L,D-transpeptidase YcbB/YkuD
MRNAPLRALLSQSELNCMWIDPITRSSKGRILPWRRGSPPAAERLNVVRGSRYVGLAGGWLPEVLRAGLAWLLLGTIGAVHAAEPDLLGETLRLRIETLRAAGDARIGAGSSAAQTLIASLYERRGFAPLWSDPSRANALLAAIEASRTHGLDPDDYHAEQLAPAAATPGERDRALAERELLLTDAYLRLAYHLYFGKVDPRTLQHGWNYARSLDGADPAAALAKLLAAPDPAASLERLAPRLPTYEGLRAALARLREVERRGGWPRIGNGPKLERGSTGPRVRQLRDRLRASGDLAAGDDGAPFDDELDAAVRRFQARHGLEADGVVGRTTLAELNTTAAERIAQVRANLERLRWVARELAGDYLLVDIAGFSAELWLNDTLAWQARVVVGRPFRTTPEFRAPMKYLVLNPEWNVPPTILREDVLPKAIRDPAYLQRHQMRVLDHAGRVVDPASIDWSRYRGQPRSFPYQIVQSPGKDNPLGSVKFMFPNEHAVYLHDTPSRALFDRTVRTFSSGCIRIDKPLALAALLLDAPQHWSEQQLAEAIAGGRTQTVPVRRTVPVMLLYFTAATTASGELQFRPDVYGRDGPIIGALAAPFRFAPVDAGRRASPGR